MHGVSGVARAAHPWAGGNVCAVKRRRLKFDPVEIELATDARDGDDTEDFIRWSSSVDVSHTRREDLPARLLEQPRSTPSRALWHQPVQRQLLLLPAIVAFVWWKWWGMSDAAWVVVALAIPMTLLYVRAVRQATGG